MKTTITRKIQIHLIEDENRQEHFEDIYRWQKICIKAANMISTAHYVQGNIQELFYLADETKRKLADEAKDPDGMLNTSSANTTYRLLSKHFKGDAPMSMLSGLNNVIQKTYKKEALDVKLGKKSLRNYRNNIPMPLPSQQIRNVEKQENGNYKFMAYGKNFVTAFGRDRSGNMLIMDRAMKGKYKLCDSSIQLDKGKMFLLAVFQLPIEKPKLDNEKEMFAELGVSIPIICWDNAERPFEIGNNEEYLYRRIQIQSKVKNLQRSLRYNNGGKGRKKKLKALERYKKKELNYIRTKLHTYSRMLIDFTIKKGCGKLVLTHSDSKDQDLLIRNWGWSGLLEFIKYKAKMVGIEVEVRKVDGEKAQAQNLLLTEISK